MISRWTGDFTSRPSLTLKEHVLITVSTAGLRSGGINRLYEKEYTDWLSMGESHLRATRADYSINYVVLRRL